ncbi:MAG: hypothetical protein ABSG97_07580 [Sedimentisphaerales bacterium]
MAKMAWLFRMSTISFISATLAFVFSETFLVYFLQGHPFWKWLIGLTIFLVSISVVAAISSLVYSVIRRGKLLIEHCLVLFGFMILMFVAFTLFLYLPVQKERFHSAVVAKRLHNIHLAMLVYCGKNGGWLPSAEHWTDLLLEYDKRLSVDDFKYPPSKYGKFAFAFNKNVQGLQLANLPLHTVLVIECDVVQNLYGGQELGSDKFQKTGEFFILESGGAVTYSNSKFANELKWEP